MVFFLNTYQKAVSQTVLYDVVIAGRTVGSVKVHHDDQEKENPTRRIDAEVSIPFYSGSLRSENQFVDGTLKTSVTDYRVNGKKKEKTFTSKAETSNYLVDFYGSGETFEKRTDVKTGIAKTIVNLYYEEPINVNAVYSEKYGQICKVENLGDSKYAVIMPSGKPTTYIYNEGKCTEVAVELGGFKLRIIRRGTVTAFTRNQRRD